MKVQACVFVETENPGPKRLVADTPMADYARGMAGK